MKAELFFTRTAIKRDLLSVADLSVTFAFSRRKALKSNHEREQHLSLSLSYTHSVSALVL